MAPTEEEKPSDENKMEETVPLLEKPEEQKADEITETVKEAAEVVEDEAAKEKKIKLIVKKKKVVSEKTEKPLEEGTTEDTLPVSEKPVEEKGTVAPDIEEETDTVPIVKDDVADTTDETEHKKVKRIVKKKKKAVPEEGEKPVGEEGKESITPSFEKPDEQLPEEQPDVEEEITTVPEGTKGKRVKRIVSKTKKGIPKEEDKPSEDKAEEGVAPSKPTEGKPVKKKKVPALQLMKIERKEIKATQLKVVEVKEDIPLFAQIKLKKVTPVKKREMKGVTIPKVLLKSNIKFIDYPPAEQKPIITVLEVHFDKGILSRNYQEALKVQKRKVKKVRIKDKEPIELEEPEKFPSEDTEKPEPVEKDDQPAWQSLPKKPAPEQEETQKLDIGKGKLPEQESPIPEDIKLKKVPERPMLDEEEQKVKPLKKDGDEQKKKKPKESEKVPLEPFEGKDIEKHDMDLEQYERESPEKSDEESRKPEVKKKPKAKKPKPEPETIQIPLEKGVPKKPQPDDDKEIKLRKKMGEPTPDEPEVITLKPFRKDKPEDKPEQPEKEEGKPKGADRPTEDDEAEKDQLPEGKGKKKIVKKVRRPKEPQEEAEKPVPDVPESETQEVISPKEDQPSTVTVPESISEPLTAVEEQPKVSEEEKPEKVAADKEPEQKEVRRKVKVRKVAPEKEEKPEEKVEEEKKEEVPKLEEELKEVPEDDKDHVTTDEVEVKEKKVKHIIRKKKMAPTEEEKPSDESKMEETVPLLEKPEEQKADEISETVKEAEDVEQVEVTKDKIVKRIIKKRKVVPEEDGKPTQEELIKDTFPVPEKPRLAEDEKHQPEESPLRYANVESSVVGKVTDMVTPSYETGKSQVALTLKDSVSVSDTMSLELIEQRIPDKKPLLEEAIVSIGEKDTVSIQEPYIEVIPADLPELPQALRGEVSLQVMSQKSVTILEIPTHETEEPLESNVPGALHATPSFIQQGPITVSETGTFETHTDFEHVKHLTETAQTAIFPQETLSVTLTELQHKEDTFMSPEIPDTEHATRNIPMSDSVTVNEITSLEIPSELKYTVTQDKEAVTALLPTTESVIVTEIQPTQTVAVDTRVQKVPKSESAQRKLSTQDTLQIQEVTTEQVVTTEPPQETQYLTQVPKVVQKRQEALIVTEVIKNTKEEELANFTVPQEQPTVTVSESESVKITDMQTALFTGDITVPALPRMEQVSPIIPVEKQLLLVEQSQPGILEEALPEEKIKTVQAKVVEISDHKKADVSISEVKEAPALPKREVEVHAPENVEVIPEEDKPTPEHAEEISQEYTVTEKPLVSFADEEAQKKPTTGKVLKKKRVPEKPKYADESVTEKISTEEVLTQEKPDTLKPQEVKDVHEGIEITEVVDTTSTGEIIPLDVEKEKAEAVEGTEDSVTVVETPVKKLTTKKKKVKPVSKIPEDKEEKVIEEEKMAETSQKEEPVRKKPKEKKRLPEKVELLKLERKEVKPTKLKITDVMPKEEVPLFAQVKLRKASVQKREIKAVEVPKVLLKSNIKVIDFPPKEHIPLITVINARCDKGILSRNTQEALKVLKRKIKKVKLPGREKPDTEELDSFDVDQKDSSDIPVEDEKTAWEKLPKVADTEKPEEPKLVVGKGKIPDTKEPEQEEIKLKKVPEKPVEEETTEVKKPKKDETDETDAKSRPKEKDISLAPFKPSDIEGTDIELEKYIKEEPEKKERIAPEKQKVKKPKKDSVKPEPETIKIPLEKQPPKKPAPEEEKDIKLKKKTGEPEPEEPESITLKPFVKEKPEEDTDIPREHSLKLDDKQKPYDEEEVLPTEHIKPESPERTIKKTKIKKTKPSKRVDDVLEDESKEAPQQDEPVLEEKPKETEEVPEEQFTMKRKPKEPKREDTEEVIVKKEEPEKPKDDVSEEITIKKKKPRKPSVEEVSEEVTIKKVVPVQPKEEEAVTEEIVIKKKKPKEVKVEEVTEEVTIKKQEPEKPKDDVSEEVTIKKKKPRKPSVEEVIEEVTIKKVVPVQPKEEEEVTEEIVVKKKKPKEMKVEEVTEEVTIKKKEPEKPKDDLSEEVTIKKKKPRKPSVEEVGEEVTIKKAVEKKPAEPKEEEVSEEITIKKLMPKKPEDSVAEFTVKKKAPQRKLSIEELGEEEITIKPMRPRQPSLPEVTEVTDVETVTIQPRITKTKEEIEQEFKIQLHTYEEEDISMTSKVRLKKQRRPTYAEEAGEQTIRIIKEIEDQKSPEIIEVLESPEAEAVSFDLKRKPSYTVQEAEEEETVILTKPHRERDEIEESFQISLRKKDDSRKMSYSIENVEEEFSIGFQKRQPTPAGTSFEEESLELKLKPKKRPTRTSQEEDFTLSIVRETEVFQEGVEEILVTELQEGDVLYSVSAYEAENEDAMNLVEGEKVYIIDMNNPDWWFVKKHLTEEKGWVPAQLLMDEIRYTTFVQKVIQQKIDQLPVFEKPTHTDKATAPRFVEKLQPKHVPDGTTVEFQCQISGSPRPQVTWFKQTAILLPSHDFQMFYSEDNVATLVVREVFPEDAGTYTCVAKNAAGFASSSTELIVEGPLSDHGSDVAVISRKSLSRESSIADILEGIPPMFTQKPVPLSAEEGSDIKLECQLVAVPEPVITWYFNKKEVDKTENVSVTVDSDGHMYFSKVSIKKVKKSQEGVYEVIARNTEGETSMPIMLKVKTTQKEPPTVLEPLKPKIVHTGEPVVLRAVITGNPTPKVTWLKDGLPADDLPVSHDGDTHSIFLKDAGEGDAGVYTVRAENPIGSAETTASLLVEGPGENMEPPLFTERFEEVKVPEKGTLNLVAKVTGNPVPEITWLRNNRPLKSSPNLTLSFDGTTSTLEIQSVDSEVDAGNYKCIAKNPAGITSHGARVSVDVPEVTFVRKLQEITEVEERESLVLECETSHTVSTHWFHEGHELSGMDHRVVVQEGRIHRLQIKNCTSRDAGLYQCRVRDQVTEGHVTVHDKKPEFVRKLQDFEVKERESAILEVEITSETADVTWHKDGEQLTDTSDKIVFEKQGTVRKLLIRGVSVHDEGEYTCALGEQECTAEVSVVELPPEITTKMQDVTVAKGEKATFEIELTKGDALVRWFKDGKELQFSEHVQLSIDGKRQRLKVYNSELKDAGVYSCEVGEQTSSARLTVEEPAVQFLKKLPDVTLIPLNLDATFTVELSRADVNVKWLMKGKEIKSSERYQITSEGSVKKLVIKNVTIEDQADYSCVALNVKSTSKLKVEIIETAPRINIDSLRKEYRTRKGDDVTIEVKFTAAPPPQDEWFINGKLVKKSPRIIQTLTENSATLTIKKAEETDVGSYTVKLCNSRGEASAEMNLILMEPPSEPGIPEVVEVTDQSITLHWKPPEFDGHCPITNYILEYHDKADFTWIQVKEVVKETTHKVSLLQKDVEYMFRVSAENDIGRGPPSHNTRYIRVAKPLSSEPPTIQKPLESVVCGLNQSITLSCVIGGIPEPTVKWMKDGKVFKSKNLTYENRIAKCAISETTETSSGIYTCQATNTAGFAETSCELKIQEPPKIEFDESLATQKLRITNQWKIEVTYSGFPKPEVVWTKNGKSLASTKHCSIYYDENSSTIAIYSLAKVDTGTYTFTARSEAGSASVDFNLKVIDKPSKPEGPIIVKDIRKDSVVLEWKPPADDGGLELSKYSVEKCDVEKMVWMKVADVEKDVSSYCVQRLREDSEYMFRIIAENPVGTSEPLESDPVTIRSKFDKPSAPRGPLQVSGMTETSFTVAWQPPESDGGAPVLEYVVERREVGKKAWQKVGSTTKDVTHIEVSGLKTNSSHHVRITARNEVGLSVPFAPEDVITVGMRISAPSAPTDLHVTDFTSKSVTLQWGLPASTGGTELTGYIIEKRLLSSKKWSKVVTLEPSVLQYCIENLKDKAEYFFRVYAENAIGLSPPAGTDLITLKKHATVPSPPTAPLEIRPIGPNAVVIAWGIPETDGGAPLQGYTIAIRDVRKTMWMEVGRVKADVHKLTIKDLQENHEYLIRIFAKNEVGPSEPLESEEPFKMLRPTEVDQQELDKLETTAPTLSFSTETTTSWMKEAGMDADIRSYARGSLLRRDEYFFRIWYYARQLFK